MKNTLFILAGATAFSLASCSQEKTVDTTTTAVPADGAVMTSNMSDEAYKARGNRMADKFASDMKISDEPTKEKLRTAYYNRSKRYDAMTQKYASDTTGMGADMRQYNTDTDAEFQGVLTDPNQYKAYQSSRSTYDEATNLDNNAMQSGSGMSSDANGSMQSGSNMSSGSSMNDGGTNGNMSSGSSMNDGSKMNDNSNMPATSGSTMQDRGMMDANNSVSKSKTKLENGAKIKVKGDEVKVKTADGEKMKM